MSNRDIDRGGPHREQFGEFFGTERRHVDDYDRGRGRLRDLFGPDTDYDREGWPGYGAEGDWEGHHGGQGGFGRGVSWGEGGDYGRGADWDPRWRSRQRERGREPRGHGRVVESAGRGEVRRAEPPMREHRAGPGYGQGRGWGGFWTRESPRGWQGWEGWTEGYVGPPGSVRPGEFAGRGPKGYRRSDERIREDVSELLTQHGEVDASDVEVHVREGEVTLRGSVDSRYARRLAEDLADSVRGVRDLHNELRIWGTGYPETERKAA